MSQARLPRHLRQVPLQTAPDLDHLHQRYGSSRASVVTVLLVVAVVTSFVGWVIWAGLSQADRDVRWSTTGFSDATTTSVTVEFDVFKPADVGVLCLVRALDAKGIEVGRAEVPVAGDRPDVHVVYALAVTARPSSALVDSCALATGDGA